MKLPINIIDLPEHDLRVSVDAEGIEELADSIRDHGLLQPIAVRPKLENYATTAGIPFNAAEIPNFIAAGGRFEVVYGARRRRACQIVPLDEIDCILVDRHDDETTAAKKLIENVQRQDLTPIEEAYGLLELQTPEALTVRELQRRTGKSREWIQSRLELAMLPDDMQQAVQGGFLSIGVARALGRIENEQIRQQYTQYAIENGCSTEQAKIWASNAEFAETGLVAMQEYENRDLSNPNTPQHVQPQYSCFGCSHQYDAIRVNMMTLCGFCQEQVSQSRPALKDAVDRLTANNTN